MPQVEPRVLDALTHAATEATTQEALARMFAAADTGTSYAQQQNALLVALRLRPSGTGKRQDFATRPPGDLVRLSDATGSQLEIWSAYAEAVSHPFVRGHLHHLLLAAGHGSRSEHIRGATTGYLEATPPGACSRPWKP